MCLYFTSSIVVMSVSGDGLDGAVARAVVALDRTTVVGCRTETYKECDGAYPYPATRISQPCSAAIDLQRVYSQCRDRLANKMTD
jgi:hypothetical protein